MQLYLKRSRKRFTKLLEGALVGALSGAVVILYRFFLEEVFRLSESLRFLSGKQFFFLVLFFALLFLGGWAVGKMVQWEPLASGSGIPHVKGVLNGTLPVVWWRVLLVKFLGGILGLGGGLSLGREGPSVQIGAMIGRGWGEYRRDPERESLFTTAGASAGIAAAFGAPLSGVVFALEELHRGFSSVFLSSSMAASLTADALSRKVFGMKPVLDFHLEHPFPFHRYGSLALLALLLGILGVLFNRILLGTQDLSANLRWLPSPLRPVPVFLLAGLLGFFVPQVLGGGHHLIASLSETPYSLRFLLLLLLLKFSFTMVSYASGTPGGIFFPLLTIGALLGAIWGRLTGVLSLDFVVLGMAGYFSAITRAPVTGTILILEMTGSFYHLPAIALSCLLSYVVADIAGGKPVYDVLLKRLQKNYSLREESSQRKRKIPSHEFPEGFSTGHHFPKLR